MPLLPPSSRPARFLSTLSLRRATFPGSDLVRDSQFLSTLSLRRATAGREFNVAVLKFLSTLSLRRATFKGAHGHISGDISIHALLAESDNGNLGRHRGDNDFYPRSPCGERPRRTADSITYTPFLSTLSLRRATGRLRSGWTDGGHFYPRSPCGERQARPPVGSLVLFISIHALLAESDHWYHISKNAAIGFLSTLSLRRATRLWIMLYSCPGNFYPRSPCGERLYSRLLFGRHAAISIHALLAESDLGGVYIAKAPYRFLSTLSLRRATA